MRDFPIFTTDYGVSSLILKEIPYKKQAFICIRDIQDGFIAAHLAECVSFCRMAGAEAIFASGHEALAEYPLYTSVWEMRWNGSFSGSVANLFPVTEETVSKWRRIYNERMAAVDNAATLEARDENRILSSGSYFIHQDSVLLGIGWLEEDTLLAMASVQPGAGEIILRTLLSLANGEPISLEVASTNCRAIRLYEKLGFIKTREISRWYQVG